MIAERVVIDGVVKNGVVVPESNSDLPEGTHVKIVYPFVDDTGDLLSEFAAWDRAGADAWRMIDQLVRENPA